MAPTLRSHTRNSGVPPKNKFRIQRLKQMSSFKLSKQKSANNSGKAAKGASLSPSQGPVTPRVSPRRAAKAKAEGVEAMAASIKGFEARKAARLSELEEQRRAAEAEYDRMIEWAAEVRDGCAARLRKYTREHLAAAKKLAALP